MEARHERLARAAALASGLLALAAAPGLPAASAATGPGAPVGAVYVASNAWSGGNAILTFPRYADGSLGPVAPAVATGGRGSGPGQFAPIVNDPLGSQGSLITSPNGQYLFVVNAGSGDVSSLAIGRGGLTLVDRQPSVPAGVRGQANPFPISLAASGSSLWVLNGIGNSLTGYAVAQNGKLRAFQNCALPGLPAGNPLDIFPATAFASQQAIDTQLPGQVGFSPDGKWLVVISKEGPISTTTPPGAAGDAFPFGPTSGPGHIYAYRVQASGGIACSDPRTTTLPVFPDGHGTFPFSFTWSRQGSLLVTEVFGESDVPTASFPDGLSAVASFTLRADGTFAPQGKVDDPLPVPCWIVRSGDNVFVASFLGPDFPQDDGGAITTYRVGPDGALIDPAPGRPVTTSLGGARDPIDMTVSSDGRFLYQLAPGPNLSGSGPTRQVFPFAIGLDGALTPLPPVNDGLGGADAATHANAGEFGIATVTFKER